MRQASVPLHSLLPLALGWFLASAALVSHQDKPPPRQMGAQGVSLDTSIDEALVSLGLNRDALGYRPKAWWASFPRANELPFLLPQFESLFAEPLAMRPYLRGKAEALRLYLPNLTTEKRRKLPGDRLRKLVYWLGVDPRISGFRTYSVNLDPVLADQDPLLHALQSLEKAGGRPLRIKTFGAPAEFPSPERTLAKAIANCPTPLHAPLARLILGMLDAREWIERALRKVPASIRIKVHEIRDLGQTQGDGQIFYPELEDCWDALDFRSLCYGAMKACDALERAEWELQQALQKVPADACDKIDLRWEGPFGTVRVTGTGPDEHHYARPWLIVDLGGDDHWQGRVGSNAADQDLSLALDLAGKDRYDNDEAPIRSQGAGVLGVGLLLDSAGDDSYANQGAGQGMGQLGIGVLLDRRGDDSYRARDSSQGAGFLGIGLCLDAEGKDHYRILAEGQGFGCIGGVGVLGDGGGDDFYDAEPDAAVAGRADYHSLHAIAANNVQGVGAGRRGDGSDGHSYAGGLGMLLDAGGADRYRSGNWSLGTGYWFGMGFVWDGGGDDRYESCYFTQASGAHFAMGAIVDEGGNDRHELFETAGAALGFGWDFVNALFLDVSGDDVYKAKKISLGCSMIRSNAFFFDLAGKDRYEFPDKQGLGWCDRRDDYDKVRLIAPQNSQTSSVALFLDLGGKDVYPKGSGRRDDLRLPTIDLPRRTHALFDDH